MDIKNLTNSLNTGRSNEVNKPQEKATSTDSATSTSTNSTDRVTLTDVLSQVRDLEAKSQAVQVDNTARIAELKAAITDGSYEVDSKSIASKLMQTELLLQK